MFPDNLSAFLTTAAILTVAPGLDTAMVLRSAAADGVRHGAFTALGIAIGCLCWGTSAAYGLSELLKTWPLAFEVLRWAGVMYLAWLGARLLVHPRQAFVSDPDVSPVHRARVATSLRRGLTTNILNPKVGLFYLTLLPQFVPPNNAGGGYALALACLHVLIALTWFLCLSAMTKGLRFWLRRPGTMRVLDRVTGGLFVALGAHMALLAGASA
jgi:threonine/homoserine/homoserine lactone efflux protein